MASKNGSQPPVYRRLKARERDLGLTCLRRGAGGEGGYPYIKYQNFEEPNLLSGNHVTLHRRRDYIQPSKPLAEIYPAYQIKASRRQLPPVEDVLSNQP